MELDIRPRPEELVVEDGDILSATEIDSAAEDGMPVDVELSGRRMPPPLPERVVEVKDGDILSATEIDPNDGETDVPVDVVLRERRLPPELPKKSARRMTEGMAANI